MAARASEFLRSVGGFKIDEWSYLEANDRAGGLLNWMDLMEILP